MNSFIAGDKSISIGIVDPTNWQRTNCVPSRPLRAQGRGRGYVRAPLDAAHLSQTQRNGTSRQGKLWRLLRVAPRPKNDPGASCVPHQIERDDFFEIDNAPITITENGKPTQIPTHKMIYRKLAYSSASGNIRAAIEWNKMRNRFVSSYPRAAEIDGARPLRTARPHPEATGVLQVGRSLRGPERKLVLRPRVFDRTNPIWAQVQSAGPVIRSRTACGSSILL